MSSVGKTVYKVSDVHKLSFGKITEQSTCDNWTWYKIDWINGAPANICQSPNYDSKSGYFRCDTVALFQIDTMIDVLESLK